MNMKTITRCMALLCSMVAVAGPAVAQHDGPPPVLAIEREFLKPGRNGSLHEKTEAAFIAAVKAGKAPIHYVALTSMSGPERALFLSGYGTFAAWEAERKSVGPTTGAALDKAMVPDGDLQASTDSSAWLLRPDLSLNMGGVKGKRFFEIQQFMVKPGHHAEFTELTKMYMDALKSVPGANWLTYENMYGTNGDAVIAITLLGSLAEVDAEISGDRGAMMALGKEQRKKMQELEAACIESQQTNLFAISPKMSLPFDDWVTADPEFWTPKPAAAPVKKTAAKPAQ
jgi:hypothetical protein